MKDSATEYRNRLKSVLLYGLRTNRLLCGRIVRFLMYKSCRYRHFLPFWRGIFFAAIVPQIASYERTDKPQELD